MIFLLFRFSEKESEDYIERKVIIEKGKIDSHFKFSGK